MSELKVEARQIVVPGQELADGLDYLPSTGTYREGDKIFASRVGLSEIDGKVIKIISVSGVYQPKRNDVIIVRVNDIAMSGWILDIRSAYHSMLSVRDATSDFIAKGADLTQYFQIGDYMMTKITNVTSQKLVDVSMRGPNLRKLRGGRIIEVNCNKVPRIIGKQGSMVSMLKNATNTRILVGQNGRIWLDGEPEDVVIAVEAIRYIEENSHIAGLTDMMKTYLEKKTGKEVVMKPLGEKDGVQ